MEALHQVAEWNNDLDSRYSLLQLTDERKKMRQMEEDLTRAGVAIVVNGATEYAPVSLVGDPVPSAVVGSLVLSGNIDRVREICGPYIAIKERRGASLTVLVAIEDLTTETKNKLKQDVKFGIGFGPLSVSNKDAFEGEIRRANRRGTLQVRAHSTGGTGLAQFDLMLQATLAAGRGDMIPSLKNIQEALSSVMHGFSEASATKLGLFVVPVEDLFKMNAPPLPQPDARWVESLIEINRRFQAVSGYIATYEGILRAAHTAESEEGSFISDKEKESLGEEVKELHDLAASLLKANEMCLDASAPTLSRTCLVPGGDPDHQFLPVAKLRRPRVEWYVEDSSPDGDLAPVNGEGGRFPDPKIPFLLAGPSRSIFSPIVDLADWTEDEVISVVRVGIRSKMLVEGRPWPDPSIHRATRVVLTVTGDYLKEAALYCDSERLKTWPIRGDGGIALWLSGARFSASNEPQRVRLVDAGLGAIPEKYFLGTHPAGVPIRREHDCTVTLGVTAIDGFHARIPIISLSWKADVPSDQTADRIAIGPHGHQRRFWRLILNGVLVPFVPLDAALAPGDPYARFGWIASAQWLP